MSAAPPTPAFLPGTYKTDLKPVWCAGCGDFGVLTALYRAMAELQLTPELTTVVSGIGCSSRLPGYVETYGFNTVHGRALPLAMGVAISIATRTPRRRRSSSPSSARRRTGVGSTVARSISQDA